MQITRRRTGGRPLEADVCLDIQEKSQWDVSEGKGENEYVTPSQAQSA